MTLDRRITDLEKMQGTGEERILFALINPDRPAEPPGRFPSAEDMKAWCDAHNRARPLIVVMPPGGAPPDPAPQHADPENDG